MMLDKTKKTNVVEKFENRPLSKHKVYMGVFRHLKATSQYIFHLPPRLEVSDTKRRLFAAIESQGIKVLVIDEIKTMRNCK
jgi:hypothetical protein